MLIRDRRSRTIIAWACSTIAAVPAVGFDLFALPLCGMLDSDGPAFEGALASRQWA